MKHRVFVDHFNAGWQGNLDIGFAISRSLSLADNCGKPA